MKLDEIQKTKETLTNTLLTLNISPLVSDKIFLELCQKIEVR
jgi:hypothetical protein